MEISPYQIDPQERYKLLISAVVPRPIALVSTIGADGKPNLAPFSFFTVASYNPMVVVFFPLRFKKGDELKDTVRNVRETAEFVINVTTEGIAEAVNACSGLYDYGVNEFEKSGLTPVVSKVVKPFRVKESPISLECRLYKMFAIGDETGGSDAIFGEVLHVHVDDSLLHDGRIDIIKMKPVTRMGGLSWGKLGEVFELPRPGIK
jgi:flavin reductase (DIM6/NTAB) family NADH-FMN oxidoreductase RutF